MQIGDLNVPKGSVVKGNLALGQAADGLDLKAPVQVARGDDDGPVLWVNAAIHGDELEGTAALWDVFASVDPHQLKGTIVGVMVTNMSAFHAQRRTSPVDNVDLNRIFPGDPAKSYTFQLADTYKKLVESHATHYIDLHGGGNWHDVVYYTLHRDGSSDAAKVSRQMALVAGSPIIWHSADHWLDTGLFSQLMEQGMPTMIVEAGGEGRIREPNVRAHAGSILNVMKLLKMIPGEVVPAEPTASIGAADFFYCRTGGIWMSEHTVGDIVKKDDVIGVIRDRFGHVSEEVCCLSPKGMLLALRTYAAAPSGSNLGIVGVMDN